MAVSASAEKGADFFSSLSTASLTDEKKNISSYSWVILESGPRRPLLPRGRIIKISCVCDVCDDVLTFAVGPPFHK